MSEPKVKVTVECECCPDSETVECDRAIVITGCEIEDRQDVDIIRHNVSDEDALNWLQAAIEVVSEHPTQEKPEE